jgi:translocation and assembly module TamA
MSRSSALLMFALLLPLPAQAAITIDIPEVTDQVAGNIRAFLSLTRYAEREDVTAETMSRLQRRVISETRAALEPLGYYEPEVKYEAKQEGKNWRVTIHVNPGRPVRLSEVTVDVTGPGANEREIRDVIDTHQLKPGLRLNHGTYESVKGALLRAAKNEGYLDARLTKNELIIDRVERRATATIEMDTGKRYSFGEIKTAQDVINDDSMRRMLRMKQGDPYTLDSLLRTQYVLDDSQYFTAVTIETGTVDRQALTVPVTVSAEPNRRHRFATSLGYGTDTEARGKFTWDNRRVNDDGHRFKLELLGSAVIKEITARYVIPVMDVALEKVEFTSDLVDEEIGDTESERGEIGTGLTQVMGRWQRVLFVRVANETTIEATGDRSVRGFALNELAPRDENGETVGGKHLATGTVEVTRDLPRNFGIATFFDIGNAFDDFADPQLEYSAGLGVRYNIAVASFGVDVAQPLSEPGRNVRFHLYISTQF